MNHSRYQIYPLTVIIAASLACNFSNTSSTPVVESSAEPTPMTSVDVSITTPPLNAILPNGLASGASTSVTTEVEFPYINPSVGDMPAHSKYLLENYLLVGSIHQPHVLIFKSDEYAGYSELTQEIISTLQSFDPDSGSPVPDQLYSGMLTAQVQGINFQNGRGLRYLTQAGQSPAPINNSGLFYYFQGLSEDGSYYIAAILPTSATYLVADENPTSPLPVDGIPFDFENFDAVPKYFETMTTKLNDSSPAEFTPSIEVLDKFVESFLIQP